MTRVLVMVSVGCLTVAAMAQQSQAPLLTKDERIEYHQLLEQTRQAQLASLAKQVAAQQQIAAGYQRAANGLVALLQSLEVDAAAVAALHDALERWTRAKPSRADCSIQPSGVLRCGSPGDELAPDDSAGAMAPREAPAR